MDRRDFIKKAGLTAAGIYYVRAWP
ncbi:MAG: twin-arginine translocation signal domain-containing protein [Deltaproteobacteria bacterium]|nr:twin-arginine translocation signal domain-containing protein [Deltaproteobacteria bacterium]